MIDESEVGAHDRSPIQSCAATAGDLTPREREVLELVGLAMTNREIALQLCLSEKTVKGHVTAVMRKLGVHNRVQAALIAERQHPAAPASL